MKKKILILFIAIISLPLLLLILNGNAFPSQELDHSICHTVPGGYTISADIGTTNSVDPSEVVVFNVTATGTDLFVLAPNEDTTVMQNGQLIILPSTNRILDNEPGVDKDSNLGAMIITFNVTLPETEGFYYLFILAGDNSAVSPNPPDFAYLTIGFSVGGVAPPQPEIEIFDHTGLILGLSALLLLTLATILVLINENKFVKIHGIFSGASWILTLINAISLINLNLGFDLDALFSFEPFGIHVSHIILGAVGLFTGLLSMLFGIAAERKYAKLTGYITLICWWTAFFLGFILVPLF
ncbi:MAG: hypothetical protein ACFE8G_04350 [Candidatus Hermodarchaeota archaeon]